MNITERTIEQGPNELDLIIHFHRLEKKEVTPLIFEIDDHQLQAEIWELGHTREGYWKFRGRISHIGTVSGTYSTINRKGNFKLDTE